MNHALRTELSQLAIILGDYSEADPLWLGYRDSGSEDEDDDHYLGLPTHEDEPYTVALSPGAYDVLYPFTGEEREDQEFTEHRLDAEQACAHLHTVLKTQLVA